MLLLVAALALPRAAPAPQDFEALECAVNAFAAELAAAKLPPSAAREVRDALNVAQLCGGNGSAAAAAAAAAAVAVAKAEVEAEHAAAAVDLDEHVMPPGGGDRGVVGNAQRAPAV